MVTSELAKSHPWVLQELFGAFKTAKERYLEHLRTNGPSSADDDLWLRLSAIVGGDPLPYGVSANRRGIEALARFSFEQALLPRPYAVEELFDPPAMSLV